MDVIFLKQGCISDLSIAVQLKIILHNFLQIIQQLFTMTSSELVALQSIGSTAASSVTLEFIMRSGVHVKTCGMWTQAYNSISQRGANNAIMQSSERRWHYIQIHSVITNYDK